jgi:hypothetical protein
LRVPHYLDNRLKDGCQPYAEKASKYL